MATVDRLSVLITGDSDSLQRAASAGERAITSLSDNAIRAAGSLRILASAADSAGDKIDGVSRSALGAVAAFATLGIATGTVNAGFVTLSGSAINAGAALAGITTAAVGLVAVLTSLAAVVGTLTLGLGALAAGFGAVIGTGILAFGEERAEQTKEQIDNIENQIEHLNNQREVFGELSDTQKTELENLKERKEELKEQTSISGALAAASADLKEELIPIVTDFGEPFIELIEDGIDGLPDFVENVLDAAGSMEEFADTIRFFGERLFNVIPDAVSTLADFGRRALPFARRFFDYLVDIAPRVFRGMVRITERVGPNLMALGQTLVDLAPQLGGVGSTILNGVIPPFNSFLSVVDDVLTIGQESDSLVGFLKTLVNNAATWLQSDEANQIIGDITAGLQDVIGGAIDGLETWLNEEGGSQKISSFASNLMGDFATSLENISEEDIREFENQLLGIIAGAFDAIVASLNSDKANSLGEQIGRVAGLSLQVFADELIDYAASEAFQEDLAGLSGAIANSVGEAVASGVVSAFAVEGAQEQSFRENVNDAISEDPVVSDLTSAPTDRPSRGNATTDETRVVLEPSSELNATIQDEAQTRAELVVQQQSDQAQRNSGPGL